MPLVYLLCVELYDTCVLFDCAIQLQTDSLSIGTKVLEKNDSLIADAYESVTQTQQAKGSLYQARTYFQDALDIRRMGQALYPQGVARGLDGLNFLLMA